MTAKGFLSQAYRIDQRINSKLEQIMSLRELAEKATATISDMPPSSTHNIHRMEGIIAKMADLESEIDADLEDLVDLKREIVSVIKRVDNKECQTLLELRYLCYKTWEQIAVDMKYGIDNIYRLHRRALKSLPDIETIQYNQLKYSPNE
jgi:DNA-directed RNA polymerase specialized sigma subunit